MTRQCLIWCAYIFLHYQPSFCRALLVSFSVPLSLPFSVCLSVPPGFSSRFHHGSFSRSSQTSDSKIGTPGPGVIGSALGLLGSMSVYNDWMGWKIDIQLPSQCGSMYTCPSRSVPGLLQGF